jgi:hypothetical protein
MIYNAGWANLKPQESKYTATLAAEAAKLIEAGETLSSVSRSLNISRATLRNWRSLNPKLNASFTTFEANKAKTATRQLHVRKYKQVAEGIVEAARGGAEDPVKVGVEAAATGEEVKEEEKRPLSPEEARQKRILEHWASDWTPRFEAMKEKAEQEELEREMELRRGFWTG